MAVSIHVLRGNQIGGGVVHIFTEETGILIDFGENLPGAAGQEDTKDVDWEKDKVDAVFFTHYHGDHIGRFREIPENIPLYMGCTARRILYNIHNTLNDTEAVKLITDNQRVKELNANKTITVGDMRITPFLVDHSAYDAYMLLIETQDKTILHTGDFRGHGYRGKALFPMIRKYITRHGERKIDILITEGTMMNRQEERLYTETQMQADAKKLFAKHRYVFLICSSTNLDSLASFYQAAVYNHRAMYANRYVHTQLKAFSETAGKHTSLYRFEYIHQVDFDSMLPGLKLTQEEFMRKQGFVIIIKAEKSYEKWIERFADLNPIVVYSMWEGYLDEKEAAYNKEMHDFTEKYHAIPMHTGGHASASLLTQVINEINPGEAIIPIHTDNAEAFMDLDIDQELKSKLLFCC